MKIIVARIFINFYTNKEDIACYLTIEILKKTSSNLVKPFFRCVLMGRLYVV